MRARLKSLILSSTALMFVVACAPAGGGSPGSPAAPPATEPASHETRVTRKQADQIVAQTELLCDGVCPPALAISLARVDGETSSMLEQCTSFLVSEDIVATNSHCIPNDLHFANTDCSSRMNFYFGSPAESIACAQIISVSSESKTNLNPDIAFVRLAHAVKRQPLRLSRMGLADEEKVTALSIDPVVVDGRHVGRLRVHSCTAKQGSLLTPQFTNDFGDVATVACEMKLGNSGSPAIARDGTVRGLLHGFRTGTARSYKGFRLPDAFTPLAFVTNAACVAAPASVLAGDAPSACLAPTLSREDYLRRMESSTAPDLDQPFAAWSRTTAPKIFTFEKSDLSTNAHKASIAQFRCVNAVDSWLKKSAAELGLDELSQNAGVVTLKFSLPLWGVQPALDSSERVSMGVGEIDRAQTTMTFDLEKARRDGYVHFTRTFTSATGRLVERTASGDLPYCK
jgi:hypothetical protein